MAKNEPFAYLKSSSFIFTPEQNKNRCSDEEGWLAISALAISLCLATGDEKG